MVKVRGYGCSSIITAIVLQFSLAGHGLATRLVRSPSGQWVVETKINRPEVCTVTPQRRLRARITSLAFGAHE